MKSHSRLIDIEVTNELSAEAWRLFDRLDSLPWPVQPDTLQEIARDLAALGRKAEEWARRLREQGRLF